MTETAARQQVEERLLHQLATTSAITACVAEGIYTLDAAGRLTFLNPAGEQLLGWAEADLLGREVHDVFHPASTGDAETDPGGGRLLDLLRVGGIVRLEPAVFVRRDGTSLPVEYSSSPILVGGEVAGAVVAFHDVSARLAAERALRDRAQLVETLHDIGNALVAELDLKRLVQLVTDAATQVVGAQFGSFFYNQRSEDGEEYSLYTLSGAPREAFERFPMPRKTAIFQPTFDGEGVVRIDDVTKDARFGRNEPYHGLPDGHLPVRSYLAAPVVSRCGKVIGGLFFGHAEPGRFDERDEQLAVGIAGQAAIAIDNANLYREAQQEIGLRARAEAVQRFLAEAGTVLASSLNYRDMADRVTRLTVPFLADGVIVDLADDLTYRVLAVAHVDPDAEALIRRWRAAEPPQQRDDEPIHRVVTTGRTLLLRRTASVDVLTARSALHGQVLDRIDVTSALYVPLTVGGRVLGTISFATTGGRPPFTDADIALAEDLARRLAAAVDNALRFEERNHVARTLQQSLLPPLLPEIPGVETAARYRPAGSGNLVGGDFYDVFPEASGGWGVVMGDVCGFGPEAAAITGIARYSVRALAQTETVPSRVLAALNRAVARQGDEERFCSALYLTVDRVGDVVRVRYANGGHPPLLVLRGDGRVEVAESSERELLGLFPTVSLSDDELRLHRGDAAVLYTDGVIEARNAAGELFGLDRLVRLLADLAGRSAHGVAAGMEAALADFAPGELPDDVALLVLRVR